MTARRQGKHLPARLPLAECKRWDLPPSIPFVKGDFVVEKVTRVAWEVGAVTWEGRGRSLRFYAHVRPAGSRSAHTLRAISEQDILLVIQQ